MKMSALFVAAAALGVVAAPVFATTPNGQAGVKATYDAKHNTYCVSQEITGRRIPVKDCRTKDEWAQAGALLGQQTDTKKAQNQLAQK